MDKKKVTRRLAMGTAIGTIAASPFILRALKGRYQTELPQGEKQQYQKDPDYEKDWNRFLEMVDVPIQNIDDLSTITLDLRPQIGTRYRVISVLATYWKRFSPAEFPSSPLWYSVCDGQATIIPPIVDTEPAILVSAERSFTKNHLNERSDCCKDNPVGECVFVPTDNGVDYFKADRGTYSKIPVNGVNIACADLGKAILFGYPQESPLAKGAKWTMPGISGYYVRLPSAVVGFANVAGKRAVKILATGDIDDAESEYYRQHRYVSVLMQHMPGNTLLEEPERRPFQVVAYVDLETGITLRQECKLSPGPKAGSIGQTSYLITQAVNS